MMIIYDIGFAAVFGIFVLLYVHVWLRRDDLELTDEEQFDAWESLEANLILVAVPAISLTVLYFTGSPSRAGLTYLLLGVFNTLHATIRGRQRRQRFSS